MVSMAGGLEFFIDGEGYDDLPSLNQVKFLTLQGDPAEFKGNTLNSKYQARTGMNFQDGRPQNGRRIYLIAVADLLLLCS